jgi:hypothetical protein
MGKHLTPNATLWQLLGAFWPDREVQAWKATLSTAEGTEIFKNLLTMAPTVHLCWDSCEFALKPIHTAPDNRSMEVKFYWLKHRPRTKYASLVESPDLPSDFPSGRGDMKFWDCLSEKKLCSGDTIIMRTDDPINRPLPSEELLRMQWNLNRVAALSGASEIFDPHGSSDDDDNYNDALIADWALDDELIDQPLWNPDDTTLYDFHEPVDPPKSFDSHSSGHDLFYTIKQGATVTNVARTTKVSPTFDAVMVDERNGVKLELSPPGVTVKS